METSVIMNSTTHPKLVYFPPSPLSPSIPPSLSLSLYSKGNHIVVGVGGECCSMEVRVQEGTSRHGDADDVISSKKLKRRRKHSQSKDDKVCCSFITFNMYCTVSIQDSGVKSGQSHMVMSHARIQTDFSEECYQKVVMFTCDGERIVTGGSDGVVRVWEVRQRVRERGERGRECMCFLYYSILHLKKFVSSKVMKMKLKVSHVILQNTRYIVYTIYGDIHHSTILGSLNV